MSQDSEQHASAVRTVAGPLAGDEPQARGNATRERILEAAAQVAAANLDYLATNRGAPVSAHFEGDDYRLVDPLRAHP